MNYSKKAQMKIQQMAFMLVAVMIFFGMVAIVYFTIVFANLRDTADDLREEEAKELARQMSGTPELMFSIKAQPYSSSVDLDKAFLIHKDPNSPFKKRYWNLDYLMIERLYPPPSRDEDCSTSNYPECKYLTLIDERPGSYSGTQTSPIAIVWWDENLEDDGQYRFGLGRIHALAHVPEK